MPLAASPLAIAAPIPRDAPVISATFPSRCLSVLMYSSFNTRAMGYNYTLHFLA